MSNTWGIERNRGGSEKSIRNDNLSDILYQKTIVNNLISVGHVHVHTLFLKCEVWIQINSVHRVWQKIEYMLLFCDEYLA